MADGRLLLSKDLKGAQSPQETFSSEEFRNVLGKSKIIIEQLSLYLIIS